MIRIKREHLLTLPPEAVAAVVQPILTRRGIVGISRLGALAPADDDPNVYQLDLNADVAKRGGNGCDGANFWLVASDEHRDVDRAARTLAEALGREVQVWCPAGSCPVLTYKPPPAKGAATDEEIAAAVVAYDREYMCNVHGVRHTLGVRAAVDAVLAMRARP